MSFQVKKILCTIILASTFSIAQGQNSRFQMILDSAKTMFRAEKGIDQNELDHFDYDSIVSLLNTAIAMDSSNAEAWYFLGYCYSRLNSRDGRGMINMDLDLLLNTSAAFEKVNKLSPLYKGEMVLLDPYSKLSSEWGSMAMGYWYNNKLDSAKWAFVEGKKRGGFGDYNLVMGKRMMDACSPNAILITYGDNFTMPLWYLQKVEDYRTDISIVDLSLLNTNWYPPYLSRNKMVSFDLSEKQLDAIEYVSWSDSSIIINNFTWTVKPAYANQYLLRGDRLFLSLLKANDFKRPLSFLLGIYDFLRLNIPDSALNNRVVVNNFTHPKEAQIAPQAYTKLAIEALNLSSFINKNSKEELLKHETLAYNILSEVNRYLELDDKRNAKLLFDAITTAKGFPKSYDNINKFVDYLKGEL